MPVRTTNISTGGFHCLTSAALEVGLVYHVKLQLTPHDALDCRAQVVRVDESDPSDPAHRHIVAFRFLDLSESMEDGIREALAALGADTDPTAIPTAWRSDGSTRTR
jgi:hypothetical protein